MHRSRAGRGLLPLALLIGLVAWARGSRSKAGRSHMSGATSRLEASAWPGLSLFSVVVVPAYIAAIITAEIVTALVDARWGVGLHVAILWVLLVHFAWAKERSEAKLLLALGLAPLTRILSLGMPLEDVALVYWFLIVGAPMIVAAFLAARTLGS